MLAELGTFLCILALLASLCQGGLGLYAGHSGDRPQAAGAVALAQVTAVACALAFAVLVTLFVQSDFSVQVVVNNSHTLKPLIYKIAGTWGNHEGSMLLWCLVSAVFGALLASIRGTMDQGLWTRAVGVQGLVTASALIYTIVLSSPFARLDVPVIEGGDLNPLLQDPALAIHPPMLYLGYVGLSVPFSLALAALLAGKVDQAWASSLRPWTLLAWTALTIGISLGSYWAYYELGWGGWWFWDPVENASFMPWLAATALVHSAIVTERRGSLAAWTILLAIIGFGLALLGTFLVRSGAITSVHAFALDPERGVAVLVMFAVALGAGLGLYAWRAKHLARPSGFAAISREGALVLNNFGLAVLAGTVLVGTLYPLGYEAVTGNLLAVGPPFFNLTFAPLTGLLFLMLPLAPLLAWRRGDLGAAMKGLWWALAGACLIAVLTLVVTAGAFWVAMAVLVGMWIILGGLGYLWIRAGRGGKPSLGRVLALPLTVWAMSLAHIGAGVLTIGAVSEVGLRQEQTVRLTQGQAATFAGRTITLDGVGHAEGPNHFGDRAQFSVAAGAGAPRVVTAERRIYPGAVGQDQRPQTTSEVGIISRIDGDLYLALGGPSVGPDGVGWTVRLFFNPLVHLIWAGMGLLALGGGLALVALARTKARVQVTAAVPNPAASPEAAT